MKMTLIYFSTPSYFQTNQTLAPLLLARPTEAVEIIFPRWAKDSVILLRTTSSLVVYNESMGYAKTAKSKLLKSKLFHYSK